VKSSMIEPRKNPSSGNPFASFRSRPVCGPWNGGCNNEYGSPSRDRAWALIYNALEMPRRYSVRDGARIEG
jgi:hypothetical protein